MNLVCWCQHTWQQGSRRGQGVTSTETVGNAVFDIPYEYYRSSAPTTTLTKPLLLFIFIFIFDVVVIANV